MQLHLKFMTFTALPVITHLKISFKNLILNSISFLGICLFFPKVCCFPSMLILNITLCEENLSPNILIKNDESYWYYYFGAGIVVGFVVALTLVYFCSSNTQVGSSDASTLCFENSATQTSLSFSDPSVGLIKCVCDNPPIPAVPDVLFPPEKIYVPTEIIRDIVLERANGDDLWFLAQTINKSIHFIGQHFLYETNTEYPFMQLQSLCEHRLHDFELEPIVTNIEIILDFFNNPEMDPVIRVLSNDVLYTLGLFG